MIPKPNSSEKIRLSKAMASQGICSRREADALIEQGLVLVDGERVDKLGTKIDPQQVIALAPAAVQQLSQAVTVLLNKPIGYVSGQPEPGYTPAINLILPENRFENDHSPLRFIPRHLQHLAPAGRLDIDSQGLLILTQNGQIARRLIGANSMIEKEYLVRVQGQLPDTSLASLRHGLKLDNQALKPAQVDRLDSDHFKMILQEGKKRQIRRMCELVGVRVIGLKRVRIGNVRLGNLPTGKWRYLRPDESF